MAASVRLLCEELACPTARGNDYYPHFNFIVVPGEAAVVKVDAEKGKVAKLEWQRGGAISHDFVRLNYDLLEADERVTTNW